VEQKRIIADLLKLAGEFQLRVVASNDVRRPPLWRISPRQDNTRFAKITPLQKQWIDR